VFTTSKEAVYLFSPTRDAAVPSLFLDGFSGILVSDFYAAYEGLPCMQQKCLLHLIRDMNDSLLEEPFNEELRSLCQYFGKLLQTIVATIDRWGLRSRYLRKHHFDVDVFYRKLSSVMTSSAVQWRERLERMRSKLFTFLSHDGVPWNNNNAEHAIKGMAMLRRETNGHYTAKSLTDYLVLLSVRMTCEFRNIRFLDVLHAVNMPCAAAR
jgi:hypothetical protein